MINDKEKKMIQRYCIYPKIAVVALIFSFVQCALIVPLEMIDDLVFQNKGFQPTGMFTALGFVIIYVVIFCFCALAPKFGMNGKVINFRVDRIASKPEILDKVIIPVPDDFDIENYTKEVFFMFSGEKVLVDLRCDNSLMKTMVDRFGEDVTTLAYDMTSFRVQTEVSASPTFFGWVFGFNGKVQILAPESVKEQYRQMIAKADEDTQESE